jgi:hypothetical protein
VFEIDLRVPKSFFDAPAFFDFALQGKIGNCEVLRFLSLSVNHPRKITRI